ncbi:hypothetical protein FQR65_LT09670 [Abscondita terminalis]|nr:hypothetical protein FQR65_LT09670 [Abscondita terminalis]
MFRKSRVSTIYSGTFNTCERISELYLNASFVEDIQLGAFNGLTNLKHLQLDQNNITEITRGLFNHLTNLVLLNLTYNSIETLENKSFLGLNKLRVLLISRNKLKVIESEQFTQLYLNVIDLSHNSIYNLTKFLDNKYPNSFFDVNIDLSFNYLRKVSFSNFPLRTVMLNLNENQISTIVGNLSENILTLKLTSNRLLTLPLVSKSVQAFDISNNAIEKLESGFFHSNSLIHLNLSNNLLQNLHVNIFDNLTKLKTLNLQDNQIDYIPIGVFEALVSLQYLNISGNRLSDFDFGTFLGLKSVNYLDISNNVITYISESTFYPLKKLKSLFVDHNLLTTIDASDLLQHLKQLKYVSLNNNPWICKHLLNVITKFRKSGIIIKNGTYTKTTNIDGIACFNYNNLNNQFGSSKEGNNYNLSNDNENAWHKFNNFFNKDFFETNFYKFFKNNTSLDFEQKLINIVEKQIDNRSNVAFSKLVSGFKELRKEIVLKDVENYLQPHFQNMSSNIGERLLNKISDIQSNILLFLMAFVVVSICLLALVSVQILYKSFKCFPKRNKVCADNESSANIELLWCYILLFSVYVQNGYQYYQKEPVSVEMLCFLVPTRLGISNPKSLTFTNSSLFTVPVNYFGAYRDILKLYLNSSYVENILPGAFTDLTQLKELYLNDNLIKQISPGVFNSLGELQILNVSNNNIQIIENNSFSGLSDIFGLLKKVEYIDLSHNYINNILNVSFINNLLYSLNLSHNNIKEFDFLKCSDNLKMLILSNNLLTKLNNCSSLNNLSLLDVSYNNSSEIKSSNANKTLITFNISYNRLANLSNDVFKSYPYLQDLFLQGNILNDIGIGSFKNLYSLKLLNLSSNQLSNVYHGTFSNLLKLETLDISSNRLKVLDESIFYTNKLIKTLNISNNFISQIDPNELLIYCLKLSIIDLHDNSWNCNFLSKVLQDFNKKRISVIKGANDDVNHIHGIECYNEEFQEILLNKIIKKMTKNISLDFENFDKSFENTTFYKFFTKNFSKSQFFNYVNSFYLDHLTVSSLSSKSTFKSFEPLSTSELLHEEHGSDLKDIVHIINTFKIEVTIFMVLMIFLLFLAMFITYYYCHRYLNVQNNCKRCNNVEAELVLI